MEEQRSPGIHGPKTQNRVQGKNPSFQDPWVYMSALCTGCVCMCMCKCKCECVCICVCVMCFKHSEKPPGSRHELTLLYRAMASPGGKLLAERKSPRVTLMRPQWGRFHQCDAASLAFLVSALTPQTCSSYWERGHVNGGAAFCL